MPGNLPSPPLSIISTWPPPNYIDPARRTWLLPYGVALGSVCTILVAIRLILRLRHEGGGLGYDDALLVPAWVILIGVYVTAIYANENKLAGIHIWDATFDTLKNEALNAWIGAFTFITGTCCLKVSVLLFYRRIQSGTFNKKWFYAIWIAIVFTVTYTVAMQLALVLNCNPTKAYWLAYDLEWSADHDFHCASTGILNLVAGILSIVTDIYSIALPCIVAQGLQVPFRQKFILNIMFGISSITIGAAIARTYLYYKLSFHYDFTWLAFDVYFWTMLEFGLGIICACAPSLRVFIKKYLGDKLSSCGNGGSNSRWTGGLSAGKRQRSESEGELTPHRGTLAGAHKSSTSTTSSSGITKKSTFEISTDIPNGVESHELQEQQKRAALPLTPLELPRLAGDGASGHYSTQTSGSLGNGSDPRSPAEYEHHVLDSLRRGRESFFSGRIGKKRPVTQIARGVV